MFSTKNRVQICLVCITAAGVFCSSFWNSVLFISPQKSSVCGCSKCLTEGDPWFRKVFNASPYPFLSRISKTSKDTFDWWKHLQPDQYNFTVYNTTVDNLFKIFQPFPDIVESSPERCRTCAVVGNSGNLKRSLYGPLIDIHDIVIRINHGRTKGYEADVGTKTTHRVMYPESAVDLDNTTHLVFFPFKTKDLLWLLKKFNPGRENRAVNTKSTANKDLVMILNPAFIKYVHERWLAKRGTYPSTGFLTLMLSLHMCDEVSVFGFGADSDGNWSHYFEPLKNRYLRTGPHPGKLEYWVIQHLYRKQKIRFFKGW